MSFRKRTKPNKANAITVYTRVKEHVFRVESGLLFCNYWDFLWNGDISRHRVYEKMLSRSFKTSHVSDNSCAMPSTYIKSYRRNSERFTTIFTIKDFFIKIKESFVKSPAQRNWCEYEEESQNNETIKTIHTTLQNLRDIRIIKIYTYFISIYAKEFVQNLDFFFQQQNKPVFLFVEGLLQQLTAFIESNITATYFWSEIENIICQHFFNPTDFYPIFQQAFQVAHNKFSAYIPNHPACSLFSACQVFNPQYIYLGDIQRRDVCHYSAIVELDNPSDGLLCEGNILWVGI
ncbi:hypothetical protein C1645_741984 [Glomus cerebriforme]|uniref:Uncharacterized protein n=1 Tax=Glomus cerebriforme TaxID=658196 RepID=A0A397SPX9_9GLOM|nr:hypothetical protein C1645_741984 [Glomus cerebriforme]